MRALVVVPMTFLSWVSAADAAPPEAELYYQIAITATACVQRGTVWEQSELDRLLVAVAGRLEGQITYEESETLWTKNQVWADMAAPEVCEWKKWEAYQNLPEAFSSTLPNPFLR